MIKRGFTLAEILITLGIIGIVAVLTIPTLINEYQKKILEAGFKKSYSRLLQSLIPIQNEFYGPMISDHPSWDTAFFNKLWENYKSIETKTNNDVYRFWAKLNYSDAKTGKSKLKDYAGNTIEIPGCAQLPNKILSDGSAIGGLYNCYANHIVFDTNGKQGPNALGHDIFYFSVDNKTRRLIPLGENSTSSQQSKYCSKNSNDPVNGAWCTKWAIENKCPDDETKTYWECLPKLF